MTGGWTWNPSRLREELEAAGYDVDTTDAQAEGGSLKARLDRGGHSQVVVVDAGGRFRGVVTVVDDETGGSATVAEVPMRLVVESRRAIMTGGTLTDAAQFGPVLEWLDGLAGGLPNRVMRYPPPGRGEDGPVA